MRCVANSDAVESRRSHHWTKSLIASPDGSKLYAGVGSNRNVAENGMEEEEGRAAIWEVDLATGSKKVRRRKSSRKSQATSRRRRAGAVDDPAWRLNQT
jgi:hypothetical protein